MDAVGEVHSLITETQSILTLAEGLGEMIEQAVRSKLGKLVSQVRTESRKGAAKACRLATTHASNDNAV